MSTDWPAGVGRLVFASLDSTNAEAARQPPGAKWILALEQTAARGRRGRAWANPKGNFAASYVAPFEVPSADAALRSFTAALALYDALSAVTGSTAPFSLKWPNDVLLSGRKLAGILLEATGAGGTTNRLIIGIGVNLAEAPPADQLEARALPPAALAELGVLVTPETLLDHLAPAFHRWETLLSTQGFQPIRKAWLDRAAGLGQPVTARMGTRTVQGRFETIDETGAIVLTTAQGRETLTAADIHF